MGTRMKPLGIRRIFSSILFSRRKAPAWACGCQAPPEVTLSEPVKPEINHSHPSKTALHRHCDWAIWASAHCLHLSLWTIRGSACKPSRVYEYITQYICVWVYYTVYLCVCVLVFKYKCRWAHCIAHIRSCECRRKRWQLFASIMQACFFFFLCYTCSQPSTTCLSCMASSAWTSFPVWRPFSFGPSLVRLPGLQSVLSVLSANCPALAGGVEWSGAEWVYACVWVCVSVCVCGSCHWRAVEHRRIHLYQSGGPPSPQRVPECKAVLRGMLGAQRQAGENVDRSGQHWTPVARWTRSSMRPHSFTWRHTDWSKYMETGNLIATRKENCHY